MRWLPMPPSSRRPGGVLDLVADLRRAGGLHGVAVAAAQATDERHRRTGWLAAASMLLNAAWLLVTQQGWIWASVVVIAALVAVLGVLVRR